MPQGLVEYLLVATGGALGCVARHAVSGAVLGRGSEFPWGTFAVNVSGSFVLALAMTVLAGRTLADPRWRLFLAVGFCGGYTTFSTLLWETARLLDARSVALATANVAGSFLAGLAAVRLGSALGQGIWTGR